MSNVLLCIDFINEIMNPKGKLAAKGYSTFAEANDTLAKLADRQTAVRVAGGRVIHVHLGFAPDYADHPAGSPILGGAKAGSILQLGSWSTELLDGVGPTGSDLTIVKKRISAFHGTSLEVTLRSLGVTTLTIAGVATDIAVQSAARDAHDRDFSVEIAAECCAAASSADHDQALANMSKFATIVGR